MYYTMSQSRDVLGLTRGQPYLGQVATRCDITQAFFATNKQFQARKGMFARDDIIALKVVLPNFYVTNFSFGATYLETGTGANATWTAAIEYPIGGTITQVKFSGASSAVVASGTYVESDFVTVNIPKGALFAVRMFYTNANGIIFTDKAAKHSNALGDQLTAAPSGLTDNTLSGAYGTDDTNNSVSPLAVVGMTRNASLCLIGDSRVDGESDVQDASGDVGELARSLGPNFAYSNFGVRGDGAVKFLASGTNRIALAKKYFSHIVVNYGINDFDLYSQSAAQLIANRQAIQAAIGLPMIHTTILPHAAVDNSAPNNAGFNTIRVAANAIIRAGVPWATYVESADAVESARDSGVWKAGYSTDYLHANQTGAVAIKTLGTFNSTRIKR